MQSGNGNRARQATVRTIRLKRRMQAPSRDSRYINNYKAVAYMRLGLQNCTATVFITRRALRNASVGICFALV